MHMHIIHGRSCSRRRAFRSVALNLLVLPIVASGDGTSVVR
jgi:hypothetical protein